MNLYSTSQQQVFIKQVHVYYICYRYSLLLLFNLIGPDKFMQYQLSQQKLQSIGLCIGYDLLTNNSDRFKLTKIWLSQGNISNILIQIPKHYQHNREEIMSRDNIQIQLGQYYFIDHSGYLLDIEKNKLAEDNFNKYLNRVLIFHDQIIQFIRKQLPCPQPFQGLKQQIQLFTKYKLKEQEIVTIIQGIIYSTNLFLNLFQQKIIQEILKQMKRQDTVKKIDDVNNQGKKVEKIIPSEVKYWNQYWNADLDKIKLKHLEVYHMKVSAIYTTYSEIVKAICEKVQRNISSNARKRSNRTILSSKNSQRPQSNLSNLSKGSLQESKQKIHEPIQNDNQFENDKNSQNDNNQQINGKEPLQDEKIRVLPAGIGRRKLQERLQAFQKKNYDNQQI